MCFFRKTKYFYKGKLDWDERSSAGRYVRENCKALKVGTCCYCCCCFMLLSLALPFPTLGATFLFSHPYHWLCFFRYKHQLRVFARFSSGFLSRVCQSLVISCAFSRAKHQLRVLAHFCCRFLFRVLLLSLVVRFPALCASFVFSRAF